VVEELGAFGRPGASGSATLLAIVAFSLIVSLFALVSSGVLTGQSLTITPRGDHALSAPAQPATPSPFAVRWASAAQPRTPADDDTPWGFFSKNIKHANSLGKWLALIFFTLMLTYMYLPRLVFGIVIVVGVLAVVKPQVRNSRLVRIGLAFFVLGFVALNVAGRFNDNPLGFGFLFAFLSPLAAVLMMLGAVKALFKRTDKPLNRDIAALVASAERARPIWPDEPPLPEVDRVAANGSRAGSALVALLGTQQDERSGADARSVHVQQQAALALCKIYGVLPTAGETVRDARSTPQDSSPVHGFWRRKIQSSFSA
jgi:hypothetical protein